MPGADDDVVDALIDALRGALREAFLAAGVGNVVVQKLLVTAALICAVGMLVLYVRTLSRRINPAAGMVTEAAVLGTIFTFLAVAVPDWLAVHQPSPSRLYAGFRGILLLLRIEGVLAQRAVIAGALIFSGWFVVQRVRTLGYRLREDVGVAFETLVVATSFALLALAIPAWLALMRHSWGSLASPLLPTDPPVHAAAHDD
jgi:hypothetical protein